MSKNQKKNVKEAPSLAGEAFKRMVEMDTFDENPVELDDSFACHPTIASHEPETDEATED